jgi:hypothetical protein
LRIAQAIDARAKTNVLLGTFDHRIGKRLFRFWMNRIDRIVRLCDVMTAAFVSRGISNDTREIRSVIGIGQTTLLCELQERAERIVHAIDRIFGRKTFAPRNVHERRALATNDISEKLEGITHHVSMCRQW